MHHRKNSLWYHGGIIFKQGHIKNGNWPEHKKRAYLEVRADSPRSQKAVQDWGHMLQPQPRQAGRAWFRSTMAPGSKIVDHYDNKPLAVPTLSHK